MENEAAAAAVVVVEVVNGNVGGGCSRRAHLCGGGAIRIYHPTHFRRSLPLGPCAHRTLMGHFFTDRQEQDPQPTNTTGDTRGVTHHGKQGMKKDYEEENRNRTIHRE